VILKDSVSRFPALRRWLFAALTILGGVVVALVLAEVFLRIVALPGVQLNPVVYNPTTGAGLHPGSMLVYRDDAGNVVRRSINDVGYADRNHSRSREAVYRVGFFGDSYTEARQVPLPQTFFRVIEDSLDMVPVESLAFGVTGFSMFQSYLTYEKWVQYYGLNLAVYVFVENDLGDQMRAVRRANERPYPILSQGNIVVDDSFRALHAQRDSALRRLGDRMTAQSMVCATLVERWRLLRRHGIKMRVTEEDRAMATEVPRNADGAEKIPNQNDNPSAWPAALRHEAITLGAAVLEKWANQAAAGGVDFVVAYVPRQLEMPKPSVDQDSWKPWLETFCMERGIPMIDPTDELIAMNDSGKPVFHDHFTPDGHVAFARAFVAWFREWHQNP
jgi:hypothetical protein